MAGGIVTHAALIENRVWLPFGGERIYPNIWALILGPSSFFRKSTCISKARKSVAALYSGEPESKTPLLPDEFSREAFLKRLSERGQGLLTYSEFSGALATFSRDYMAGTKETVADLYDCPSLVRGPYMKAPNEPRPRPGESPPIAGLLDTSSRYPPNGQRR